MIKKLLKSFSLNIVIFILSVILFFVLIIDFSKFFLNNYEINPYWLKKTDSTFDTNISKLGDNNNKPKSNQKKTLNEKYILFKKEALDKINNIDGVKVDINSSNFKNIIKKSSYLDTSYWGYTLQDYGFNVERIDIGKGHHFLRFYNKTYPFKINKFINNYVFQIGAKQIEIDKDNCKYKIFLKKDKFIIKDIQLNIKKNEIRCQFKNKIMDFQNQSVLKLFSFLYN